MELVLLPASEWTMSYPVCETYLSTSVRASAYHDGMGFSIFVRVHLFAIFVFARSVVSPDDICIIGYEGIHNELL